MNFILTTFLINNKKIKKQPGTPKVLLWWVYDILHGEEDQSAVLALEDKLEHL